MQAGAIAFYHHLKQAAANAPSAALQQ